MSAMADTFIAYRILSLLVTPIKQTEAFRLGIVDARGNPLKKDSQLIGRERDAYTFLHRLVFRLKKILDRSPERSNFTSLAAATALVREFNLLDYADLLSEEGVAGGLGGLPGNSVSNGQVQDLDKEPVIKKPRKIVRRNPRLKTFKEVVEYGRIGN